MFNNFLLQNFKAPFNCFYPLKYSLFHTRSQWCICTTISLNKLPIKLCQCMKVFNIKSASRYRPLKYSPYIFCVHIQTFLGNHKNQVYQLFLHKRYISSSLSIDCPLSIAPTLTANASNARFWSYQKSKYHYGKQP